MTMHCIHRFEAFLKNPGVDDCTEFGKTYCQEMAVFYGTMAQLFHSGSFVNTEVLSKDSPYWCATYTSASDSEVSIPVGVQPLWRNGSGQIHERRSVLAWPGRYRSKEMTYRAKADYRSSAN